MAPISSSELWYCGCSWRTTAVISERIARSPLDVSVTRTPVSSRTSVEKTFTPASRTLSSVSALPMVDRVGDDLRAARAGDLARPVRAAVVHDDHLDGQSARLRRDRLEDAA